MSSIIKMVVKLFLNKFAAVAKKAFWVGLLVGLAAGVPLGALLLWLLGQV